MSEEQASPQPKIPQVEVDLDARQPCGLTRREILQLRRSGIAKPEFISWAEWVGPKKLSHRHYLIAHLAALGYGPSDIAASTGFSLVRVSQLLSVPEIQLQIRIIREVELQGKGAPEKVDQLSSQALRVYEQILFDPNARAALKQKTAQDVLNRKMGMPHQKVDHGGSLLKDFIHLLQVQNETKTSAAVETSSSSIQLAQLDPEALEPDFDDVESAGEPLPESAPAAEAISSPAPADKIESWLEENSK